MDYIMSVIDLINRENEPDLNVSRNVVEIFQEFVLIILKKISLNVKIFISSGLEEIDYIISLINLINRKNRQTLNKMRNPLKILKKIPLNVKIFIWSDFEEMDCIMSVIDLINRKYEEKVNNTTFFFQILQKL